MDRGNVNKKQHLPWWLKETTKRTPISLVSTRIWTRTLRIRVQCDELRLAPCSVHSKTLSQTALDRWWEMEKEPPTSTTATMIMLELGKSHYCMCHVASLLYHVHASLHAINGLLAVGGVGNLLCGPPHYKAFNNEKTKCTV